MTLRHAVFLCLQFFSLRKPPVGAGLLAKAVGQPAADSQAGRIREQARSHKGLRKFCGKLANPSCRSNTKVVWNLALSRIE
ncbi:hypothetical protein J2W59_003771 [Pseudomonas fluorescens]|nr:hypothetical protein [Pseudomonas fluorescens]